MRFTECSLRGCRNGSEGHGNVQAFYKGNTGILYIPSDLVKDSCFPLKEGNVVVEIKGDTLIIRKG